MARIFTTPAAEQAAKAFLHDMTLAAGVRTKNQRSIAPNMPTWFVSSAKEICDEIVNRDFANIDNAINTMSGVRISTDITNGGNYKTFKAETIAKSLVYMAELLDLYWDDTVRTPFELNEFKTTILGAAVYKYGRYISALANKPTRKTTSTTSTAAGNSQPPKNNYKQSGPQSGNVRDLQDLNGGPGTPGQKVHGSHSQGLMFKLMGDNTQSKNKANVFIKPLSAAGAHGSTNKVFISSGNGYTDCTCYFDDPNEAQAFLDKLIADSRIPSNVTNMQVVKLKADPNGYFLVGTEYGRCAVSAKTLNEALAESLKDINNCGGWDKATEGYSKKELDELHTWMRRD